MNIFSRALQNIWRIKNTSIYFARTFIWILVLGRYLFLEAHSFRILEQIRSTDTYPYLFSRQIGAIVYIVLYGDVKFSREKHRAI